jgi:sugar lactone lactonase YvrE
MADLQPLLTGLAFGESPRWHQDRLWLADWGTQEIIAVDLDSNREVVVRVPTTRPETQPDSGGAGQGPYSIDWLPDGSLVPHGDLSGLDRGFNEIVVDGRGNAYLNGAGFDFVAGEEFAHGFVALVTPDGAARQVADGIAFPNGMAVTPDNRTRLPVAQGEEASWPRPGPMSIRSEAIRTEDKMPAECRR